MRRKLVAGNWKMHGTRASVRDLVLGLRERLTALDSEIVLCPPFIFLEQLETALRGSDIALGAQNLAVEASGAFTGEISGPMLTEFACRYVLVGHSERRSLFAESDERVALKFQAAQKAGLIPILCVGESLAERDSDSTLAVVNRQLNAVLDWVGIAAFDKAVIAYEPVWAIGTGRTATPAQAQAVHRAIRTHLAKLDGALAARLQILYGGSVKADNAAELFACEDIDGGLIGGASLSATDFAAICAAAG